jgi:predicted ester cyclase
MSVEVNVTLVQEWVDAIWNGGKLDLLGRFHPPVFENHGRETTIEDTKQWHQTNRTTFPDIAYTIEDIVSTGDRVTFRWTARATHQGMLWNFIPPTGKEINWSGMHMLRLKNNQIIEVWALQDTLIQLQQMGVTIQPPGPK